jgi:Fe-Mn family superoxide dismutase
MFERVKLPYGYADLEPYIDQETVKTHYDKHHKTYTDNFLGV